MIINYETNAMTLSHADVAQMIGGTALLVRQGDIDLMAGLAVAKLLCECDHVFPFGYLDILAHVSGLISVNLSQASRYYEGAGDHTKAKLLTEQAVKWNEYTTAMRAIFDEFGTAGDKPAKAN